MERESKAKSITYITVLSSTKISQPWAGHEMVWKTQKGQRRNSGYPGFASQRIPRQQTSLQSTAKGVPCLSHHIPGVPLVPPSPAQIPAPTPQNSLQIHLQQSLQPPNLWGLGFLCCSFGFLNFSRGQSPPSLQYTEFPEISHEVSWDFTCPMPSSIILVVKYSLQHCIQNLCPHSRPVKYCNDKEHKTLPHFITGFTP